MGFVGIVIGFVTLISIGGLYCLYKLFKRQRRINRKKKFFERNGGLLLQQQLISTQGNVEQTKIFSSKELEKATENFGIDRVLGQGGQGTVYKGMLVDGRIVAVKKSKVVDEDKLEEFINEVVILSQINHRKTLSNSWDVVLRHKYLFWFTSLFLMVIFLNIFMMSLTTTL